MNESVQAVVPFRLGLDFSVWVAFCCFSGCCCCPPGSTLATEIYSGHVEILRPCEKTPAMGIIYHCLLGSRARITWACSRQPEKSFHVTCGSLLSCEHAAWCPAWSLFMSCLIPVLPRCVARQTGHCIQATADWWHKLHRAMLLPTTTPPPHSEYLNRQVSKQLSFMIYD